MTRNKNTTFLFAVLCVVTITAAGIVRDEGNTDSSDEMTALSLELRDVSFLLGKWSGTVESRRSPTAKFDSGEFEMTVRSVLGGTVIETRYSGAVMNRTRRGSGRLSYDSQNKTYRRSWTDSLTSMTLLSVGSFADSQLTMTGSGSFFGLDYQYREVTTNLSDTSMAWLGEFSLNDGESWFTMLKISVVRVR